MDSLLVNNTSPCLLDTAPKMGDFCSKWNDPWTLHNCTLPDNCWPSSYILVVSGFPRLRTESNQKGIYPKLGNNNIGRRMPCHTRILRDIRRLYPPCTPWRTVRIEDNIHYLWHSTSQRKVGQGPVFALRHDLWNLWRGQLKWAGCKQYFKIYNRTVVTTSTVLGG